MKKVFFFLSLVFTICTAKATDYYIASNGNDNNSGTSSSSPWKSINKLNAYFSKLKPGDRVLFRKGDTFYGSINVTKSGSAGAPIVIGAYGSGEKPIVTGLQSVTSWKNLGNNIWESSNPVSSLNYTQIVVVNGRNTPMGKYPNSGYLQWQTRNGDNNIYSNMLSGTNWTGAEIAVFTTPYLVNRAKILSHAGNLVNFEKPAVPLIWQNPGSYFKADFVIQNDPRTLDTLNEWYFNPSTKKLRIYDTRTPSDVKVSSQDVLVDVSHKTDHLVIENIDFKGAGEFGVHLGVSNYITIKGCDFESIGKTAVYGGNHGVFSRGTTVENCVISQVYGIGIDLSPYFINNNIVNNSITNIGMFPSMANKGMSAQGIDVRGDNSIIGYNRVDSTGSSGIQFRGNNTIVHNNYVKNFCIAPGYKDGGGIYTWAGEKLIVNGSKVIDNIVMHGTVHSKAIDLDDGANGIEVSGNTAVDAERGIYLHNARNIKIFNNTTFDNYEMGILISSDNPAYKTENIELNGNIFFAKEARQFTAWFTRVGKNTKNFVSENNYYSKPISNSKFILTYNGPFGVDSRDHYGYPSLSEWQSFSGQDKNSKSVTNTITDVNKIKFEYNPTKSNKTISLGGVYVDSKGTTYNGSIVLKPFSSAVLIKTGEIKNENPIVNAGSNQTITLPESSVTLKGTASDKDGEIISYSWKKVSGPAGEVIESPEAASSVVSELEEGKYVFELTVMDNLGGTSSTTVDIVVQPSTLALLPAVGMESNEQGVNYKYYEANNFTMMPDFASFTPAKSGVTSGYNIDVSGKSENFAIEFSSLITIPSDGNYTFYTNSDDGSKLYIDNKLVVDNDGLHGPREISGSVGLKKGNHIIRVEYFQQTGGKLLTVSYAGNGISKRQIPQTSLFTMPDEKLLPAVNTGSVTNGLKYKYYEGTYSVMPDFKGLDPVAEGYTSSFDLSKAVLSEYYLLEFEGYIDVPSDGSYNFYTVSDDGSMLYIDDVLVVNNDGAHHAIEKSGTVGLKAGRHTIRLEYFQRSGGQTLNAYYSGPNLNKTEIPSTALFVADDFKKGLNYKYYEQGGLSSIPDFTSLTPVKTGVANQVDLTPAVRSTSFLLEFDGYIKIPADGEYTFYLTSDDGSMLYINDALSIDNDGAHSAVTKKKKSYLTEGYHPIKVEYFQQGGGKGLSFEIEGPGMSKRIVTADMLYRQSAESVLQRPAGGNLINGIGYKYFESSSFGTVPDFSTWKPLKTGILKGIDISPASRSEVFGFEYSGYIQIEREGYYTFYTNSDDGSLLYINGVKVVDNDGLHSSREMQGRMYLEPGYHTILVNYFQETGYKNLSVSYEGPGISKRVIPGEVLFVKADLANEFGKLAFSGGMASTQPLMDEKVSGMTAIVKAYPNPFVNSVSVSLAQPEGKYEIEIFDVGGRILYTKSGEKNAGLYVERINTGFLQKGLYFIRVTSGGKTETIKVEKR